MQILIFSVLMYFWFLKGKPAYEITQSHILSELWHGTWATLKRAYHNHTGVLGDYRQLSRVPVGGDDKKSRTEARATEDKNPKEQAETSTAEDDQDGDQADAWKSRRSDLWAQEDGNKPSVGGEQGY